MAVMALPCPKTYIMSLYSTAVALSHYKYGACTDLRSWSRGCTELSIGIGR